MDVNALFHWLSRGVECDFCLPLSNYKGLPREFFLDLSHSQIFLESFTLKCLTFFGDSITPISTLFVCSELHDGLQSQSLP